MKVNFVRCDEEDCGILMEASWVLGGWLLILDSMLEKYKDQPKKPFIASHITTAFPIPCYNCNYEITGEEEDLCACLVAHGDHTACLSCPKCNRYIPESSKWHYTTWDEDDLILEDWVPPWKDNEMKDQKFPFFYKLSELNKLDIKPPFKGNIRDLE